MTLTATSPDTLGPFYPLAFAPVDVADLQIPFPGVNLMPLGETITISGRIIDRDGNGATRTLIEMWHADSTGQRPLPGAVSSDPAFLGFTRLISREGDYMIRTIRPGGTEERAGWITLSFYCDGIVRLVTQIFLEDDPELEQDLLYASVPDALQSRLVAHRIGDFKYHIDIILAGGDETPFFADTLKEGKAPGHVAVFAGDNTSGERSPRACLLPVPSAARASFVPWIDSAALPPTGKYDNDLTTISPLRGEAKGEPITLAGRVIDSAGMVIPDVLIEIWIANAFGRYSHPDDTSALADDPCFLGIGRAVTDDAGRFSFRLIKPGAYLARPDIGRWRPAHVHVSLLGRDVRLVTQLYFPGDPHQDDDPMRLALGDAFDGQLVQIDGQPGQYRHDFVIERL
jgi:protocatechuate 3,4-dioxygenase, beta subunit